MSKIQIAIDGESATGKSTLAVHLAKKFIEHGVKIWIIDTGQAYRLLTMIAIDHGMVRDADLPQSAANELVALAGSGRISFLTPAKTGHNSPIALDGEDYSSRILSAHSIIDEHVSLVAKCGVRPNLIKLFQQTATDLSSVIMVGRDIGERVLPDAIKFYLEADSAVRANRRAMQLNTATSQTISSLSIRDQIDTQHKSIVKPLDSFVINTVENDINQMTRIAWDVVSQKISF